MSWLKAKTFMLAGAGVLALSSCEKDPGNTGFEFAPQMYHSLPYEPYSQILDKDHDDYNTIPVNETKSNLREPAPHTIHRRQWAGTPRTALANDIMIYDEVDPTEVESSTNIANPLPATEQNLAEGKVLYLRFCLPCHGENGDGQGKVAAQYKGVPSYKTGRYQTLSSGHIYHTITYGKGRMWPHGSQMDPHKRWQIVQYVHELQKSE